MIYYKNKLKSLIIPDFIRIFFIFILVKKKMSFTIKLAKFKESQEF